MFEEYRNRMARKGKNLSDVLRYNSDVVVNSTWMQSTSYRPVMVKYIDCGLPEFDEDVDEILDAHFEQKSKYNITGDEVAYWLIFRPHELQSHPEIRVGAYVNIPDSDNVRETWLIVHIEDDGEQKRLQILKCNWIFKWISGGQIYEVLGCQRYTSSYNSGIFYADRTTSVENMNGAWLPTNSDTALIEYDQRFIISDGSRKIPICWIISKVETTIPIGLTKLTLAQVAFDPVHDNVELGIANYYSSAIAPVEPGDVTDKVCTASIVYNGMNPTVKVGGSFKIFTPTFSDPSVTLREWIVSDESGDIIESNDKYTIEYDGDKLKLKITQDYELIGRVLIVQVFGSDGSNSELRVEVV